MLPTILVTGWPGQLATSLQKTKDRRIVVVGRDKCDLGDPEKMRNTIDDFAPALIVNAAAWTAVDLAESHLEAAKIGNETGPATLAEMSAQRSIPFIHISTDYVFSGEKGSPYSELDPVSPRTVYGRTKVAGEQAVLALNKRATILRTAWVYSAHGKNFVRTMLSAGAKNIALKVVGDQRGNPTCSDDLARLILKMADKILAQWDETYAGIFHASGSGEASWFDLAEFALREAAQHGQKFPPELRAIETREWPTPAPRPMDSRLDCSKLKHVFGLTLPDWHLSVAHVVRDVIENAKHSGT